MELKHASKVGIGLVGRARLARPCTGRHECLARRSWRRAESVAHLSISCHFWCERAVAESASKADKSSCGQRDTASSPRDAPVQNVLKNEYSTSLGSREGLGIY